MTAEIKVPLELWFSTLARNTGQCGPLRSSYDWNLIAATVSSQLIDKYTLTPWPRNPNGRKICRIGYELQHFQQSDSSGKYLTLQWEDMSQQPNGLWQNGSVTSHSECKQQCKTNLEHHNMCLQLNPWAEKVVSLQKPLQVAHGNCKQVRTDCITDGPTSLAINDSIVTIVNQFSNGAHQMADISITDSAQVVQLFSKGLIQHQGDFRRQR